MEHFIYHFTYSLLLVDVRDFLRLRAIPLLLARVLWALSYSSIARRKTTDRCVLAEGTSKVGEVKPLSLSIFWTVRFASR